MTRLRTTVLLFAGVALAIGVSIIIAISIGNIRDGLWFGRILQRIEREGPSDEHIASALQYARDRNDWQTLLQIAWRLPEDRRWRNVAEIASVASERFAKDGSWRLYAAYAYVRDGRYSTAREKIAALDSSSALAQKIELLSALDPNAPEEQEARLAAFSQHAEENRLLVSVGEAFRSPTAQSLEAAGEATNVPEFFLAGALNASENGDRPAALRMAAYLKTDETLTAGDSLAVLYLARWLEDNDWFFRILETLGGRTATRSDVRLMQAEFLYDQNQYDQADRLYREIIGEVPGLSAVPFVNRTVILRAISDFPDENALRAAVDSLFVQGLSYHPGDHDLRVAYASYLISVGRRFDAIGALVPIGPIYRSDDRKTQRRWLLTRIVLGARSPVERLEADLWAYINAQPQSYIVATFLARFLMVRDDQRGLETLRNRYSPTSVPWATTLHAINATRESDFEQGLELFSVVESLTGRYNLALFYLQHGTLNEAERFIVDLQSEAERVEDGDAWYVRSLLLAAELERIRDNPDAARAIVHRARSLSPYNDEVYTYETLLASYD